MADEWSQLHSQVLRIQKRILLVVVSNGHTDFVHPEIFEEHWELLSDQLVCWHLRMLLRGVLQLLLVLPLFSLNIMNDLVGSISSLSLGRDGLKDVLWLVIDASFGHLVKDITKSAIEASSCIAWCPHVGIIHDLRVVCIAIAQFYVTWCRHSSRSTTALVWDLVWAKSNTSKTGRFWIVGDKIFHDEPRSVYLSRVLCHRRLLVLCFRFGKHFAGHEQLIFAIMQMCRRILTFSLFLAVGLFLTCFTCVVVICVKHEHFELQI